QPIALVQRAEGRRPRKLLVGLSADLGHGLWDVDLKIMRRRVLTGVQTVPAVMTQVGHVIDVRLVELQAARHGREYRAETFAITTGITDLQDTSHFRFVAGEQRLRARTVTHGTRRHRR